MIDNSTTVTHNYPLPAFNGERALELLQKHIASSALYDSKERFDPPKCDEDTRVGLIEEISDWLSDTRSTATRLTCMTGPAGSGKSALAQSIAELYASKHLLAATFFFFSTDNARNHTSAFVSTLAYQIVQAIDDLRLPILRVVEKDPAIFERSLETQFSTLVVDPIQQVMRDNPKVVRRWPYVIIIDGLDECTGEQHQAHILRLIATRILDTHLPFKIFLTSRPELAIRTALAPAGHLSNTIRAHLVYRMELSNYDATADIRRYFQRRLRAIALASSDPRARAIENWSGGDSGEVEEWPGTKAIEDLVENASGQFIYAATVIKFVGQPRRSPVVLLEMVLSWTPGVQQRQRPFAALDMLYKKILETAESAYQAVADDEDIKAGLQVPDGDELGRFEFQDPSGPPQVIVRLLHKMMQHFCPGDPGYMRGSPLCKGDLEAYLRLHPGEIEFMTCDLHSLIKDIPNKSDTNAIEWHHKSFLDFLSDPVRSGTMYVSRSRCYAELAHLSFGWILQSSEEDILDTFKFRGDTNNPKPNPALEHALYYWTRHWKNIASFQNEEPAWMQDASRLFRAFAQGGGLDKLKRVLGDPSLNRKPGNLPMGQYGAPMSMLWLDALRSMVESLGPLSELEVDGSSSGSGDGHLDDRVGWVSYTKRIDEFVMFCES